MGRVLRYRKISGTCPECGSSEFSVVMLDNIYPHPLYVKRRHIYDGGNVEVAKENIAKYCVSCGLIVGGMVDNRREYNWDYHDVLDYFTINKLLAVYTKHDAVVRKKLNRIIHNLPEEKFRKLCSLPFSIAVNKIREMMIWMEEGDGYWKKVI